MKRPKRSGGGEGAQHRGLKQWVCEHPEAVGVHNVTKREMEHRYASGDEVDILFITADGMDVVVEIDTDDPLPGAYQLVKYRALRCAELGLPLDSDKVRAVLVAWTVDKQTARFCDSYGIRWFEEKL